jgi:hypothetical protein
VWFQREHAQSLIIFLHKKTLRKNCETFFYVARLFALLQPLCCYSLYVVTAFMLYSFAGDSPSACPVPPEGGKGGDAHPAALRLVLK